jgi:hypothetical protein
MTTEGERVGSKVALKEKAWVLIEGKPGSDARIGDAEPGKDPRRKQAQKNIFIKPTLGVIRKRITP